MFGVCQLVFFTSLTLSRAWNFTRSTPAPKIPFPRVFPKFLFSKSSSRAIAFPNRFSWLKTRFHHRCPRVHRHQDQPKPTAFSCGSLISELNAVNRSKFIAEKNLAELRSVLIALEASQRQPRPTQPAQSDSDSDSNVLSRRIRDYEQATNRSQDAERRAMHELSGAYSIIGNLLIEYNDVTKLHDEELDQLKRELAFASNSNARLSQTMRLKENMLKEFAVSSERLEKRERELEKKVAGLIREIVQTKLHSHKNIEECVRKREEQEEKENMHLAQIESMSLMFGDQEKEISGLEQELADCTLNLNERQVEEPKKIGQCRSFRGLPISEYIKQEVQRKKARKELDFLVARQKWKISMLETRLAKLKKQISKSETNEWRFVSFFEFVVCLSLVLAVTVVHELDGDSRTELKEMVASFLGLRRSENDTDHVEEESVAPVEQVAEETEFEPVDLDESGAETILEEEQDQESWLHV